MGAMHKPRNGKLHQRAARYFAAGPLHGPLWLPSRHRGPFF